MGPTGPTGVGVPGPAGVTGPAGEPCCPSNGELLVNNSFDDFIPGGGLTLPATWLTDFATTFISHPATFSQVHTGDGSVIFTIASVTPVATNLFQVIDASPGCWYDLMFWLATAAPLTTFTISSTVTFLDASLTPISSTTTTIHGLSLSPAHFKPHRHITPTAPGGTAHIRAELIVQGTAGDVWLDDMQLTVGGCGGAPV